MKIDRAIAALAILLAGSYFYATRQIKVLSFGDPIGPRLFPYLITAAVLIGAVILILETMAVPKDVPQPSIAPDKDAAAPAVYGGPHIGWMIAGVIGWTLLYIFFLEKLGYVLSTMLFLLGLTFYFHRQRHLVNTTTSLLVPIVTYFVFNHLLSLSLPAGLLGFLEG